MGAGFAPRCIHGLYLVTDAVQGGPQALAARVAAALGGGARIVQYRDKCGDDDRRAAAAAAVLAECRRHGALCIVNDDPALAARVGADGVHLGEHDAELTQARSLLGPQAVIGISCYDSLERAREAAAAGASYVAFGAFYPSTTKPAARRATLALLEAARRELDIPIVAIGGIDASNAAPLIQAGADALAVVGAVWWAPDPRAAARAIAEQFPQA